MVSPNILALRIDRFLVQRFALGTMDRIFAVTVLPGRVSQPSGPSANCSRPSACLQTKAREVLRIAIGHIVVLASG
jgi:hypothetical protein